VRIVISALLISLLSVTACHKKTSAPVPASPTLAPPQPPATPTQSADEQSCRAFTQNFYDWYWNRYSESATSIGFDMHSLPNVDTVLKRQPSILSPELSQLLTEEEKKKSSSHATGKLDFDPFWGNQNPQGKYTAGRVLITGDRCKVSIPQGDEIAELQKSGPSWVFVNFYYCFAAYDSTIGRQCPDSDLLQILKQ
jgi:hypothetical protein